MVCTPQWSGPRCNCRKMQTKSRFLPCHLCFVAPLWNLAVFYTKLLSFFVTSFYLFLYWAFSYMFFQKSRFCFSSVLIHSWKCLIIKTCKSDYCISSNKRPAIYLILRVLIGERHLDKGGVDFKVRRVKHMKFQNVVIFSFQKTITNYHYDIWSDISQS